MGTGQGSKLGQARDCDLARPPIYTISPLENRTVPITPLENRTVPITPCNHPLPWVSFVGGYLFYLMDRPLSLRWKIEPSPLLPEPRPLIAVGGLLPSVYPVESTPTSPPPANKVTTTIPSVAAR